MPNVLLTAYLLTQTILLTYCQGNEVQCIRPNEVYNCGSGCQTTCDNYNEECDIINVVCNRWCYCKEGYARDRTGTCIPIRQCKAKNNGRCCKNEIWTKGSYTENECLPQLLDYVSNETVVGCFCINGYKRNPNGKCVPVYNCPRPVPSNDCSPDTNICKGPNEEFKCGVCDNKCSNETCDKYLKKCEDGCFCKDGHARNHNGICVPETECNNLFWIDCSKKPHEHYACGGACQTTCKTLYEECKIINIRCNDMCYCDDGYARNDKDVCIPIKKCPPKIKKY